MITTVNGVLGWLNTNLSLSIPLLPLYGWPQWVQALWQIVLPTAWQPPSSVTLPLTVQVGADWPIPNGSGGTITLTIVSIDVVDRSSPEDHG